MIYSLTSTPRDAKHPSEKMVQATMQSYMVGEIETSIEIKAPAQKYYHMLTGKPKDLPEASPDNLQRCDVLEGEPGKVGRILSWNYNLIVARVIGGDLMKEFKNFFLTIQATPKQREPGSVVKCHLRYERIDKRVADPEDILVLFAMMKSSLQGEVEADVEIKAPATEFFHMFAARPQDVSKASPENVQGCNVQGGEMGRVGTLITWNYVLDGKPKVATERIEAVDPKKNMIKLKVIEGDLTKDFKNFIVTIQVTPKQGGPGGVAKLNIAYERIDENVAHPETLLQTGVKMFKDIDEMLSG
ncbi:hypothetical protein HID58_025816 [Brassica napus]|uniref:Bet v I/Major latex protein domain-containing protein n=1 Tax=Brassica napus TaxID=3708 RepID=A0ABQ8CPC5_BRANA|nr:hypothetical protein HID58_025816 [Brassica napus]